MPSASAARAHHKAVIRRTPSSSHHVNLRSCLVIAFLFFVIFTISYRFALICFCSSGDICFSLIICFHRACVI